MSVKVKSENSDMELTVSHTIWSCSCGNSTGNDEFSPFFPCDKNGDHTDPSGDWEGMFQCEDCGSIYIDPLWSPEVSETLDIYKLIVGKCIVKARKLTRIEATSLKWKSTGVILGLSDGSFLIASCDDVWSGPGSLIYSPPDAKTVEDFLSTEIS